MTALERAARAVDPMAFDLENPYSSTAYRREAALETARAVLMAVRVLDEKTKDAYYEKCRDMGIRVHINASCAMETMLDAILNEGQT